MTNSKRRPLRKEEIDDWFGSEVTKQFFSHLDKDLDTLLNDRITGSFYHPGEPYKTQEGFAFTSGMEYSIQKMRDRNGVHSNLLSGFEEDSDVE